MTGKISEKFGVCPVRQGHVGTSFSPDSQNRPRPVDRTRHQRRQRRLYDGTAKIHAAITDAGFRSCMNYGQISFSKGGVLARRVRTPQWQTSDGTKTEYAITDGLDHRPAGLQIRLPGL
ncbi:hypothetical protein LGN17_27995 [Burkholderia sp. AU30280]|uniref:hypothetical protein n=1 Tax=Burkholderia sp. AU30280 TaxID=2879628 RepID=UPI001CF580A1|nr:hypothetical protein [Burkholderia sp. AU30280]MCA8276330.1 hypothetical protein [Burkholderia sp. AU30280]